MESRREERVFQLLRMLNLLLSKQKAQRLTGYYHHFHSVLSLLLAG